MMEAKLKHLELIQGVVNRLASDSFRMKGWSVVLIAALFALMARENRIGQRRITTGKQSPREGTWRSRDGSIVK